MSQIESSLLAANACSRRIRLQGGRWPLLEKRLVALFTERRAAGKVVRRKWFERNAKALFKEIYPNSTVNFMFSEGWFGKFLRRNHIALRFITNKAQETPQGYSDLIINFLCFNRRNSQLRVGTEDSVRGVGRYLLANILNMDQTPLPWEYLEGRTYDFMGKKTVWVHSKKSGWGKRQATIQLTVFADGIARVKPLIIYRGMEKSKRVARKKEEVRYDSRVVVKFNKKAYANTGKFVWLLRSSHVAKLTISRYHSLLAEDTSSASTRRSPDASCNGSAACPQDRSC